MSNWQDYLDLSHGAPFRFLESGDESCLTEDDVPILRPDADKAITQHPECAAEFLLRLADGKLDLHPQQRIARLMLEVWERCHRDSVNRWAVVRPALDRALSVLSTDTLGMMEAQGASTVLTDEALTECYGHGPDVCIRHGLSVARTLAHAAFLKALANKLLTQSRPSDLCGDWKLVVSAPEDPVFAEVFAGVYGGAAHARITARPKGARWELVFLNFPAFPNWFGLEGAAYEAAASTVAKTLAASVIASGELSD